MNAQEQNWKSLFGDHTLKGIAWHGIWTVYSREKEIVKSFQGVRSFRVNEEQTAIIHTNNYTYPDGSTAEQTWPLEKQSCNQPDGVIHLTCKYDKSGAFALLISEVFRRKE